MDDVVMLHSARNAYLVVLVLLVAISTYQFYTFGGLSDPIAVLWVAGAGSFFLSKWYYNYQERIN